MARSVGCCASYSRRTSNSSAQSSKRGALMRQASFCARLYQRLAGHLGPAEHLGGFARRIALGNRLGNHPPGKANLSLAEISVMTPPVVRPAGSCHGVCGGIKQNRGASRQDGCEPWDRLEG